MTAFVVPESTVAEKRKDAENRFEFKLREKGKTFSVPKMEFLSRPATKYLGEKYATTSEADLLRGLIKIEAPDAFDIVDKFEDDQAIELSVAWAAASKITPGESEASEIS
ncbi:hypothetical protein C1M55_10400 [Rhodococcus qingshengii]|uniref:hypothetical protein n=1 Tax=Rhodococcus qingshengii TaxID=334542 RepID=UPI0006D2A5EF|nr:hypothetical protein [Rhodococcus qingshengii]AUS31485.1 hypothetical protein C1M55_10400 [Rhodococcus qingshengii]